MIKLIAKYSVNQLSMNTHNWELISKDHYIYKLLGNSDRHKDYICSICYSVAFEWNVKCALYGFYYYDDRTCSERLMSNVLK